MKKTIHLTSFLLFLCSHLFATYSIDWVKPADNYLKTGTMIARDKANNVIVTGYITANGIYSRKYNKFGDLLWEKSSTSGVSGLYERSTWVTTDASNNVLVVGYRYALGSGSSFDQPNAVVVLKYNAAGVLQWKQTVPISFFVNNLNSFSVRGEVDASGNLYVGTSDVNHPGFALMKFSPTGSLLFFNGSQASGGAYIFNSMRLKGGKVVLSGSILPANAVVSAFDFSGNLLWENSVLGHGGKDVEIDGSGNTYLLSSYPNQVTATSQEDPKIYKFDASGAQLWVKNYDFGGFENPGRFTLVGSRVSVICAANNGGGYFHWRTFQTNLSGVTLWSSAYTGAPVVNDQAPRFIAAKTNGEVFVTGYGGPTPTPNTPSNMRMITLKYGSTGATQWVDSLHYYNGWGIACTLATDNSLFVVSGTNMTAYHFLDHTGTGTCGLPTVPTVSNITTTSAKLTWTAASGAYLYHLRYKPAASTVWTTISTNLLTKTLTGLAAGTTYNFALEAVCSSGPSGYTATQSFSTTGVGYCASAGLSQAQEYLNHVWIGGINNFTTTPPTSGYSDYTAMSATFAQGAAVSGFISGLVPYPEYEYYRIWVDYNHDFDFADPGELAVDLYTDFTGLIAVNFTVPANAALGSTRMRITQSHDAAPAPCGSYARGETEDYSLNIVAVQPNPVVSRDENTPAPLDLKVYPNPFSDKIFVEMSGLTAPAKVSVFDLTGKMLRSETLNGEFSGLDLSGLNSGVYMVKVQAAHGFSKTVRVVKQ